MQKIYILTNVLPYKYGGRTKSLLQRAELLDANGYEVEILFTGIDYNLAEKFENLYVNNIIPRSVKTTSMWLDMRKETNIKKYEIPAKNSYGTSVIETEFYEGSNNIERVKHLIPLSTKCSHVDTLASDGTLIRRSFYPTGKKMTDSYFYNADGSLHTTFKYELKNNKNQVVHIEYENGKYSEDKIVFNTYDQYKTFWINQYIGNETCNVIIDPRLEDKNVINAKLKNAQLFFVFHGDHLKPNKTLKTRFQHVFPMPQNSHHRFIVLTEEQAEDIRNHPEYGGIDISVIGHPIEQRELSIDYDDKRFIILSRLAESKQVLDAIKAFTIFWQNHQDYYLDIYGDGDEKDNLAMYIKYLNPGNNIQLKGFTADGNNELQKSLATIIATRTEGNSLSIIESLANGCPIASYTFKYGQQDNIINGVNGFIAQENSPQALANTLEQIIKFKQDRQQIASTVDKYSREALIEKWNQVLI